MGGQNNSLKPYQDILGIVPFVAKGRSSFFFTEAFLLFLAPAGALNLRGQLPNNVGQSPNLTKNNLFKAIFKNTTNHPLRGVASKGTIPDIFIKLIQVKNHLMANNKVQRKSEP